MKPPRPPPPPSAPAAIFGALVEASLAEGLGVGAEVRWIHAGEGVPALGYAEVAQVSPSSVELVLEAPARFRVDARLVVEPRGGRGPRWILVVTGVSGRRVAARLVYAPPVERREYPRLEGEIRLRYGVSAGAEAASAWMNGGPMEGAVRAPAPQMEFSVTGLAFVDMPLPPESDTLLMELGVADKGPVWRCVARVVGVVPVPGASPPDATHRIAVQFVEIPKPATLALVDYTLRVQEALTGGPRRS
ncbi:MAG: hypothetical protein V4850_31835 [Myxococcota bacterium]